MKKQIILFFFMSSLIFMQLAYAVKHSDQKPNRILLTIDMIYQILNDQGEYDQYQIQNVIYMLTNDHQWVNIRNKSKTSDVLNDNELILLAKVENVDNRKAQVNFVIIDAAKNQPSIVSSPKIVVQYGQLGQIQLNSNNQKLRLTVLAGT